MKKVEKVAYVFLVIIALGGAYFLFSRNNNQEGGSVGKESSNPFENIVIPESFDEATREVIQEKIDNTKIMYDDKPDIWETWINIGNLKVLVEDYQGAIDAYRKSIQLQSNNILGYRNIAEVYKNNLKDYEKAKEYYRLAIEINPKDIELYIALALVEEFKLEDYAAAEETYLNGLKNTNNDFSLLHRILTFYKNRGELEKADEIQRMLDQNEYSDTNGSESIFNVGM